ncbi:MAG: HD-GYP domain-containing protein (c-di-GMP phosphodiesterase class II) [Oleiphilaceae bacterium]|jgi:HD-GYP domain-containing protein (c-di-GMP phosphodiesterase class II)
MRGEYNHESYKVSKKLVREKIGTHSLKLGMYVVALDRPWGDTPFLFQGFLINHEDEIDQLCEYCDHVYIDVTQTEVKHQDNQKPRTQIKSRRIYKVSTESALPAAIKYYDEAKKSVDNVLAALRLSHDINVQEVKVGVRRCVKSVLNNPNALLWLSQIKNRDDYTAEHSLRVAILSIALGRELNLLEKELEDLGMAGMLHDVGKIKIPLEVLNKEGSLSKEEYDLVKTHATEGRKLLMSKADVPPVTVDVAYCHHEFVNGKGYPRGISAEKIPYFAKIVSVVDAFDAITSDRVYSEGRSTLEAMRILYDCKGHQFDDDIVRAFIRLIGIYPPGHIVELNNGEAGIILSCQPNNKLRPKVIVVRNSLKKLCPERIIDLSKDLKDHDGKPLRVKEVFADGEFGIRLQEYKDKGLKFGLSLAS